jgi:dephospho-CoA kinase
LNAKVGPRRSTRCGTTIYVVDCLRNRILLQRVKQERLHVVVVVVDVVVRVVVEDGGKIKAECKKKRGMGWMDGE